MSNRNSSTQAEMACTDCLRGDYYNFIKTVAV